MKQYLGTPVRRNIAGWTIAATMAVILAACGGGNDGSPPATMVTTPPPATGPAAVPGSAVVDIASFISYLNTLMSNDMQEPLLADAVTPPTSETAEPTNI